MSMAEVVKKKGRPKKTVAGTIAIIDEPVQGKVRKPRLSRKSATSPIEQQEDFTSAAVQAVKDEPPPVPPKVLKEPKPRSPKSVGAERIILASQQVKAPSTRPEPSIILSQATTAFAEVQKDPSSPNSSESARVEPQTRPKTFKPAGTLPAAGALEAPNAAKAGASPQSGTSPFLAAFLTEPPVEEQPAWSRPKTSATISASSGTSPKSSNAAQSAAPHRPTTAALFTASQPPKNLEAPTQTAPESRLCDDLASSSAEAPSETSPGSSTRAGTGSAERKPSAPTSPSPSPAEMSGKATAEAATPAPRHTPPASATPRTLPKLPPRGTGAPAALKPTQMPYEVLKRDPKFRALSRRYTGLIVAIPVLLATSYALYGRYTETSVQRKTTVDTRTINGGV